MTRLSRLAPPLWCAILLAAFAAAAWAQTKRVQVEGRIKTSDGKPAAGLQVTLIPMVKGDFDEKLARRLTTDAGGRFKAGMPAAQRWVLMWEATDSVREATMLIDRPGPSLGTFVARTRALTGVEFEGCLGRSLDTRCGALSTFALAADGNALLCDAKTSTVKVVTPSDALVATWTLPFAPQAIDVREDGSILVGGAGRIVALDAGGQVALEGKLLGAKEEVTAIAHSGDDVFVCTQATAGFAVTRLTAQLTDARRIITGLSGCCGQFDIKARDGRVYTAENGSFRIGVYDREGKVISRFTKSDPKAAEYYGEGCCEPKNICFGPDGTIYASSSGKMMVKRYTQEGKYLGQVAVVPSSDGGCVRLTISLTPDGSTLYMLDTDSGVVRRFNLRKEPAS